MYFIRVSGSGAHGRDENGADTSRRVGDRGGHRRGVGVRAPGARLEGERLQPSVAGRRAPRRRWHRATAARRSAPGRLRGRNRLCDLGVEHRGHQQRRARVLAGRDRELDGPVAERRRELEPDLPGERPAHILLEHRRPLRDRRPAHGTRLLGARHGPGAKPGRRSPKEPASGSRRRTASRSTARAMARRRSRRPTTRPPRPATGRRSSWDRRRRPAPAPRSRSGYPDIVYLCANSPLEVSGPGRLCYKSLDGGITFTPAGYTSPTASNPRGCLSAAELQHGRRRQPGDDLPARELRTLGLRRRERRRGRERDMDPGRRTRPPGTTISGTNLQLAVDHADNLYAMWTANGLALPGGLARPCTDLERADDGRGARAFRTCSCRRSRPARRVMWRSPTTRARNPRRSCLAPTSRRPPTRSTRHRSSTAARSTIRPRRSSTTTD